MPWPSDISPKTHVADSDQDPDLWRNELNTRFIDAHNEMVQGRGTPDGVAALNSSGQIEPTNLPVIPVERGGTGATTQTNARANLGLGTASTRNVDVGNGVAGLDANGEVVAFQAGAFGQPPNYVKFASGVWGPVEAGPNSISRTSFKTAVGFWSANPSTGNWANVTLAGGPWGLNPTFKASTGSNRYSAQFAENSSDFVELSRIAVYANLRDSQPLAQGNQVYFLASPPYDFGDGECEDFLYVLVRDGEFAGTYFACDPPHANNGRVARFGAMPTKTAAELSDPWVREEYIESMIKGKLEPIAEGMALKMYDLPAIPHPFGRGEQVFMVDPMGDEIKHLRGCAQGGVDPIEFLVSGAMTLDNEPLASRHGPPGVPVVRARWKNNASRC